jgi:hypothetical protein
VAEAGVAVGYVASPEVHMTKSVMVSSTDDADVVDERLVAMTEHNPRPRVGALRDLVFNATRTVQHSVDLAGATMREELESFAVEARRTARSLFCAGMALALLTAATVAFLREVTHSWAVSFLVPGVLFAAVAAPGLFLGGDRKDDAS